MGGDRGEVIHSISNSGKPLADKIGVELKNIGQSSMKIYSRKNGSGHDYYGMIKYPKAIAVIVEVCFIDNKVDVQIADTIEEQRRNGKAIAHGILKELNIPLRQQDASGTLYQVVAGTYSVKSNAEAMEAKLKAQGIGAFTQIKK